MRPTLFHLHCLSPLHCGTGQAVGVVDLPIARARASQLPIVPGSSLRGVLRQHVTDADPDHARTLFGPRSIRSDDQAFAGALSVGDAHLLLLPVRCLAGVVCFVTSPFVLKRYVRDLSVARLPPIEMPAGPVAGSAKVTASSANLLDDREHTLVLEDLDLPANRDARLDEMAQVIARSIHPGDEEAQADLVCRFTLVPDEIMAFLAETATEVRARIAIDSETGAVRDQALWYEESLPAETVLWGVMVLSNSRNPASAREADDLAARFPSAGSLLQLGGGTGVGRGLVRLLCRLGGLK